MRSQCLNRFKKTVQPRLPLKRRLWYVSVTHSITMHASRKGLFRPSRRLAQELQLLFRGCRCLCGNLSWKVRYRTFLWFFRQMSKLYRARSRLYRRQILQVNTRWKAPDEIYNICMLLHRSDLNISAKSRQTSLHFSAKICKNSSFSNNFHWILLRFRWNFVGFPMFPFSHHSFQTDHQADILENVENNSWNYWIF